MPGLAFFHSGMADWPLFWRDDGIQLLAGCQRDGWIGPFFWRDGIPPSLNLLHFLLRREARSKNCSYFAVTSFSGGTAHKGDREASFLADGKDTIFIREEEGSFQSGRSFCQNANCVKHVTIHLQQ